jgi:quercetin dioxygenase-like cupin family protein
MFEKCPLTSFVIHVFQRIRVFTYMACAIAFCGGSAAPAYADVEAAKKFAKEPGVIFARELVDVPGKNLVVMKLEIPPKSVQPAASHQSFAHRHPGSVYLYVAEGTVRFAIEGQPVRVVHAGESAFEPVGAIHTILENTDTKKPATVIAVLLVPDGAPIVTPVEGSKK